jgi:hypothetical protein
MHNCRETVEQVTELLLDGADRVPDEALSAELRRCAECRSEFDSLSATLRITTRLIETATPSESYWTSYHAKLRQRVEAWSDESHAKAQRPWGARRFLFVTLRQCVRATVPVPAALVIAMIFACAALVLFAMRPARQPSPNPIVVHVPVEVPVVQERVVTRVVYRERQAVARSSQRGNNAPKADSAFAQSRKQPADEVPSSFVGFKPTEEVKLTVIKGAVPNEK